MALKINKRKCDICKQELKIKNLDKVSGDGEDGNFITIWFCRNCEKEAYLKAGYEYF